MDDLAAALLRLADAFPDDAGPAADPFTLKDEFDLYIWYGPWAFDQHHDFVERMLGWTPRVLRLLTGGQLEYYGEVPARFLEAGWREWPPGRRAAIEDVLRAWWAATLTEYPSTVPVADVLAVVAQMTDDARPWLTTWSAIGGVTAARQLSDLIQGHISWSPHLDDFDRQSAGDTIRRWLLRDGVDVLCALPAGAALDAVLAELAKGESEEDRWWWL